MGLFDSVWADCECGEDLEFQSKAGACELLNYKPDEAPKEIVDDLNGQVRICPSCGQSVWLTILVTKTLDTTYSNPNPEI
jgi:hypothetical protein